jgi:catechol 2,3-dioxygenase-like lactoylglutathione lyase family enzyme
MSITVNHIVVPAHDHEASARWFAEIMGLTYKGTHRHLAPVHVNDTFMLDYANVEHVQTYHIAFHVSDDDFEGILSRLQAQGIPYGSRPQEIDNMRTDHPFGGQGLYFLDLNNHLFEVMTKVADW